MGKINDLQMGRQQGMEFALRVVKEKGIEALEQEIKARGIIGYGALVSEKDLKVASEAIKQRTLETVLICSVCSLMTEFGFGKKRLERFEKGFNEATSFVAEDYCTWQDYIDQIREQVGMELELSYD